MMPMSSPVGLVAILLMLLLAPPQTPKQPLTSQTVYQYVLPKADLIVTGDSAPWLEGIWERIEALEKSPLFTQIPMLAGEYRSAVERIKRSHAALVQQAKFDPLKHFRWGTVSLQFQGLNVPPIFLAALGGEITAEVIQALVAQIPPGRPTKQVGTWTVVVVDPQGTVAAAISPGQPLLFGSTDIVALATQGKLNTTDSASLASQARGNFQTGAMFHLAAGRLPLGLSAQLQMMTPPAARSFLPLLLDLEGAFVAAYPNDTLDLTVRSSKAETLQRYRLLMEGLGSFVIAGDYSTRGLIKILDGLISSNPELYPEELRPFLGSKTAIFDLLQKRLGSQQARYSFSDQPAQTTLRLSNLGGSNLILLGLFGAGAGAAVVPRRMGRRARRLRRPAPPVEAPTPAPPPSAFPPAPPSLPGETPASRPSK